MKLLTIINRRLELLKLSQIVLNYTEITVADGLDLDEVVIALSYAGYRITGIKPPQFYFDTDYNTVTQLICKSDIQDTISLYGGNIKQFKDFCIVLDDCKINVFDEIKQTIIHIVYNKKYDTKL